MMKDPSQRRAGKQKLVWEAMSLSKIGRLGDIMQGNSTSKTPDGGGTGMRPPMG